jgi:hypothetical protein
VGFNVREGSSVTGISRRRFLGGAAGATGAVLIGTRIAVGQTTPSTLDVAIVGGGMSGLFCAMRLQAAGLNVGLFEASDRLGGRVMSVLLPGFSEEAAEIGAMRLRSTDTVEMKLVDTLLGPDAKADFAYPTQAWFLRDRLLRALDDPTMLPYGLDATERAIVASGKDLLVETIRELAGAADMPVTNDQGIWGLILKARSMEGRNFMVDSAGYNALTFNWNAEAALPWFEEDFGSETVYFKIRGGLQRLPIAIAAAYAENGGLAHTNHPLRTIERNGDGGDDSHLR